MNRKRIQNIVKNLLKIVLTVAALYYVFQKIDFKDFLQNLYHAEPGWLLLAFIFFNVSKVLSAFRILKLYESLNIRLGMSDNLKLYYLGMFYNLFLPGAIGGDGYKIYLLKQSNKNVRTRQIVGATLLDRLSGLAAIFVLAFTCTTLSSLSIEGWHLDIVLPALAVATLPVFYFFVRLIFPVFVSVFGPTTMFSFGVQLSQVICAIFILKSLSIESGYLDYLALFLVSSIVSVLPFTVGGVGARELVFLYGFQFLPIIEDKAIAFTLLFFIISAVTALAGLFFSFGIKSEDLSSEEEEDLDQSFQT